MESPNEVKEKNKNANNNQWVYPGWIPIDKKEEDKDAVETQIDKGHTRIHKFKQKYDQSCVADLV